MILSGFTLIFNKVEAQETKTLHLNSMLQMSPENKASYKLVLTPTGERTYDGVITDFLDQKKAEGGYAEVGKRYLEDGHFKFYHPNGNLESEGEFVRGIKVGTWKRYDVSGRPKADRYYPVEDADKIRSTMQLEKVEDEKPQSSFKPEEK